MNKPSDGYTKDKAYELRLTDYDLRLTAYGFGIFVFNHGLLAQEYQLYPANTTIHRIIGTVDASMQTIVGDSNPNLPRYDRQYLISNGGWHKTSL